MGFQGTLTCEKWDFMGFHGIIWVSSVVTLLRQKPGKIMNDRMCPPISISILYQTYTVHKIYLVHIIQIIYIYIYIYIILYIYHILYIIIIYYNIYCKYPQRFFLHTISRSPPTEIHSLKADGWKDISTRGPETEHVRTWWTERSGMDCLYFHDIPRIFP